ncbi:MAG: hypothetical protein MHM6MM_009013, partial [Cercozoa sp. M6MM]
LLFVHLPTISDLPKVTFAAHGANAADVSTAAAAQEALVGRLSRLIDQQPASSQLTETVKQLVATPAAAQLLLDELHTVISFVVIGETSGENALNGKILLSDFASNILQSTDQGTTHEVWKVTPLKNVRALWQLLRSRVQVDVFAAVQDKYRKPLPADLVRKVREASTKLDCIVLLPALRLFILQYLREGTYDADQGLSETVGYLPTVDGEGFDSLAWFKEMPEGPRLKHALSFYHTLKAADEKLAATNLSLAV